MIAACWGKGEGKMRIPKLHPVEVYLYALNFTKALPPSISLSSQIAKP